MEEGRCFFYEVKGLYASTEVTSRSMKCIFIRYILEFKVYRLYDLIRKKMILSRDAEFDEISHILERRFHLLGECAVKEILLKQMQQPGSTNDQGMELWNLNNSI